MNGKRRPGQRPLVAEPGSLGTFRMTRYTVEREHGSNGDGVSRPRWHGTIERADPEIWIHPNMIEQLRAEQVIVTSDDCIASLDLHTLFVTDQALLTITDADGRTVIYRVDLTPVDGLSGPLYYACWPD